MPLCLRSFAVLALACTPPLAAAGSTEISTLLRQLESLERQAQQQAALTVAHSAPDSGRYHFDYWRLQEDLRRIRSGVQDYLTPVRAQPRDTVELRGDYRQASADEEAP